MVKIIAVCTSEKKGMRKTSRAEINIKKDYGVAGPGESLEVIGDKVKNAA